MQKKNIFFSYMVAGLLLISISHITQTNDEPFAVEQLESTEVLESFEGFDDYDMAIEEAIEMGIFKSQSAMRQPYWGEVPLRKVASFLFMRYIDVRSGVHAGCATVKSWTSKAWKSLFGGSVTK